MGNLSSALQQLRTERKQAQSRVEKLDQAISVIESLNGSGTVRQANQPTRLYRRLRGAKWRRRKGRDGQRLETNHSQRRRLKQRARLL